MLKYKYVKTAIKAIIAIIIIVIGFASIAAFNNHCAIAATLSGVSETKYIKSLEDSILPAIDDCKEQGLEINSDNVVKAHVRQDIEELLSQDTELVKYMKKHNVEIVPAYYHLDTGVVDFYKN